MKILYRSSWKEAWTDALRARVVKWFLRKLWVKGQGPKFWLLPGDTVCREILTRGLFDKTLLRGLAPILAPYTHGTVLDVGANIGNHALFFAGMFKQVVSFEPNPDVFAILQANVRLNRVTNVALVAKGLGAKAATLPFYDNMAHNFGAMGFVDNGGGLPVGKLDVVKGDDALKDLGIKPSDVAVLKLDVEGFELDVLKGMPKVLAGKPLVVFESLRAELGAPLVEHLKASGYSHFYEMYDEHRLMGDVCAVRPMGTLEDRYYALIVASADKLAVCG